MPEMPVGVALLLDRSARNCVHDFIGGPAFHFEDVFTHGGIEIRHGFHALGLGAADLKILGDLGILRFGQGELLAPDHIEVDFVEDVISLTVHHLDRRTAQTAAHILNVALVFLGEHQLDAKFLQFAFRLCGVDAMAVQNQDDLVGLEGIRPAAAVGRRDESGDEWMLLSVFVQAFGKFVETAVFQPASLRIGCKKRWIVGRDNGPAVLVKRNQAAVQEFAGERLRERLCGERLRGTHGNGRGIDNFGGSLPATFKRLLPPLLGFAELCGLVWHTGRGNGSRSGQRCGCESQ